MNPIERYESYHITAQYLNPDIFGLAFQVADCDILDFRHDWVRQGINTNESSETLYVLHRLERLRWLDHGLAEALVAGLYCDLYPHDLPTSVSKNDIQLGFLLHDLGKPNATVNPGTWRLKRADMTVEEKDELTRHVDTGGQVLLAFEAYKNIKFPQAVWDILENHHEKEDGSGKPLGKQSWEIPYLGKLAVAIDQILSRWEKREYHDEVFTLSTACADVFYWRGIKYDSDILNNVINIFRNNLHLQIDLLKPLGEWSEDEFQNHMAMITENSKEYMFD